MEAALRRPELDARRQASRHHPHWQLHRDTYKKARGVKRELVVQWNIAWNQAGRSLDFPDFEAWIMSDDGQRIVQHFKGRTGLPKKYIRS
jgi:hypothetical protein